MGTIKAHWSQQHHRNNHPSSGFAQVYLQQVANQALKMRKCYCNKDCNSDELFASFSWIEKLIVWHLIVIVPECRRVMLVGHQERWANDRPSTDDSPQPRRCVRAAARSNQANGAAWHATRYRKPGSTVVRRQVDSNRHRRSTQCFGHLFCDYDDD